MLALVRSVLARATAAAVSAAPLPSVVVVGTMFNWLLLRHIRIRVGSSVSSSCMSFGVVRCRCRCRCQCQCRCRCLSLSMLVPMLPMLLMVLVVSVLGWCIQLIDELL